MIQKGANSIREQIKTDVLQEIQRILLSYEERIAVLEKENRLLFELNKQLCNVLEDLSPTVAEEVKAKINAALSNETEA